MTLIASGLTYVVSTGKRVIAESRPTIVEIVAFSYFGRQAFGNFGPRRAYLSHMTVSGVVRENEGSDALKVFWEDRVVRLDKVVDAGAFVTIEGNPAEVIDFIPALEFDDAKWRKKLEATRLAETCIRANYYSPSDPKFVQLNQTFGEALRTFPASGELVYMSGSSAVWQKTKVSLVGVFIRKQGGACDEWLGPLPRSFIRHQW